MRTSQKLGLVGLVSATLLSFFTGCDLPAPKTPEELKIIPKIRGRVINEARSSHKYASAYAFACQDEQTGEIYCYNTLSADSTLIDARINKGDLIEISPNPSHSYLLEQQIKLIERAKSQPEVSASDY